MPPLARKLLIIAALDGLLLTPLPLNGNSNNNNNSNNGATNGATRRGPSRPTSPLSAAAAGTVQIDYKTTTIRKLLASGTDEPLRRRKEREEGLEVHGIAGLLHVSSSISYLVAITSRKQVASIDRIPVYVITDVALIPLASQATAQEALVRARETRARFEGQGDSDVTDNEGDVTDDEGQTTTRPSSSGNSAKLQEEDSAGKKGGGGSYGIFAQKWFSRAGWTSGLSAEKEKGKEVNTQDATTKLPESSSKELVNGDGAEEEGRDVIVNPSPNDADNEIAVDGSTTSGTNNKSGDLKPENKPAPELESFPALPLSEEEKAEQSAAAENVKNAAHSLTPKLLHTTRLLLASSRSFFFSYELDITRPLGQYHQQKQKAAESGEGEALWTKVDPLYFWNKNLQRPFINSKLDAFILPLMQGFVAQTVFRASVNHPTATDTATEQTADTKKEVPLVGEGKVPFILTLISRRSTKRAGLRYLRRGVDSEGNTANCVETEQLLSIPAIPPSNSTSTAATAPEIPIEQLAWEKTYSFLQVRGSIPVYFQQSPYALRPKPVLMHGETTNRTAFEKHFVGLEGRYAGEVFGVNLVERGSAESIVGEKYERYVRELNEKREALAAAAENGSKDVKKVGFTWFDFHKVCKGMKFEKVSLLVEELEGVLDGFGWTEVEVDRAGGQGKEVKAVQKGIVRTNCMDCLDRTNVVQSACGRRALEKQLEREGVDISKETTNWFNLVWADNGDAISKQYASTAALKGDFTRTRKRNYRGALTDLGLTMSRYFTNIISDFFTQAAIDFLLGNVSNRVFDEFEVEMMSKDPAAELTAGFTTTTTSPTTGSVISGVRQNAIEICTKIVISDDFPDETLIQGWTFLTPDVESTLRTFPFRETVVLLTKFAIYVCRFDFSMEKVLGFERVDLRRVREVQVGTYITSTLAQASVEAEGNVGLVVRWAEGGGMGGPGEGEMGGGGAVRRVNTRTAESLVVPGKEGGEGSVVDGGGEEEEAEAERKRQNDLVRLLGEEGQKEKIRFVAFKALPGSSAIRHTETIIPVSGEGLEAGGKPVPPAPHESSTDATTDDDDDANPTMSPREQVRSVAYKIEKAVLATFSPARRRYLEEKRREEEEGGGVEVGGEAGVVVEGKKRRGKGLLVREEDIISLEQAKKKTGLLELVGYQVRRLVWA